MKRLKSVLIVMLIFASGVVVGGIMGIGATVHDFVNKTFRDGPPNVRRVLLQRAKQDLKLDDDQSHQFWEIFNDTGKELRDVLEPVLPQVQSSLLRAELRLRNVLKESQKAPFDNFVKIAKARWQAAFQGSDATSPPRADDPGEAPRL
jgi:hypothetical protein